MRSVVLSQPWMEGAFGLKLHIQQNELPLVLVPARDSNPGVCLPGWPISRPFYSPKGQVVTEGLQVR